MKKLIFVFAVVIIAIGFAGAEGKEILAPFDYGKISISGGGITDMTVVTSAAHTHLAGGTVYWAYVDLATAGLTYFDVTPPYVEFGDNLFIDSIGIFCNCQGENDTIDKIKLWRCSSGMNDQIWQNSTDYYGVFMVGFNEEIIIKGTPSKVVDRNYALEVLTKGDGAFKAWSLRLYITLDE